MGREASRCKAGVSAMGRCQNGRLGEKGVMSVLIFLSMKCHLAPISQALILLIPAYAFRDRLALTNRVVHGGENVGGASFASVIVSSPREY